MFSVGKGGARAAGGGHGAERPAAQACDLLKSTLQSFGQHGPPVHTGVFFGHGGNQGFGDAERASHIAQSAARPVTGHHGRDGRTLAPVFGVDVLNHFFTPLVFKDHINVRRLVALAADKALKQHAGARRIHLGHAQAVAHR